MRIIDKNETITWLTKRGIVNSERKLSLTGFLEPIGFLIPSDSGVKSNLSKLIASFFDAEGEAMLWIHEWGIWPSCENWYLFDGFRKSLGDNSQLYEKPGHIFSKKDIDAVGALTAMVLYFVWGAVIVSTARNFVIEISHDEWIELHAKDQDCLSELQEKLNQLCDKMGEKKRDSNVVRAEPSI